MLQKPKLPLRLSEEVADALSNGLPIVALESNVITHGLPFPMNIEAAEAVETAVRKGGAVPATIFIEDGCVRVGAEPGMIERFASLKGVPKVSSRDLAIVLASGVAGATTVASSVICAEQAGIQFFASAGIGGVHRGAQISMDVSADLIQFTRSRVAVVCAGAKNILDLGLTLEFLETHSVPLVAYQSNDFPAFYCASSGFRSPHRVDSAHQIAQIVRTHFLTEQPGGVVITTPPRQEDALNKDDIEVALQAALEQARRDKITGSGLTKFLMRSIDRATDGRTSKANRAVLISTAETGGQLAAAYALNTLEKKAA